jgi:predicted permease
LEPDSRVFAYLAGITLFTGTIAGVAPAAESLRTDLSSSLKGDCPLFNPHQGRRRTGRGFLVGVQVALSLVLLVGAGIVASAQYRLLSTDANFETGRVLVVRITPPSGGASDRGNQGVASLLSVLERRIEALPGVTSACYCTAPFSGAAEEVSLPPPHDQMRQLASAAEATPELFQTLGIPIVQGRTFDAEEANRQAWAPVTVVSENLARFLWPGEDPVGKNMFDGNGNRLTVVGVAREVTSGQFTGDVGQFYVLAGRARRGEVPHYNELLVRFTGDALALESAIRKAGKETDQAVVMTSRTLREGIAATGQDLWPATLTALFLAGIGGVLAFVGVYGVVAFSVSRRTKELGIRMALGATRVNIMGLVLGAGLTPIIVGASVGLALSLGMVQVLARVQRMQGSLLHGQDPIVYVAVVALVGLAAVAAMLAPALRAANSDPVRALRED